MLWNENKISSHTSALEMDTENNSKVLVLKYEKQAQRILVRDEINKKLGWRGILEFSKKQNHANRAQVETSSP